MALKIGSIQFCLATQHEMQSANGRPLGYEEMAYLCAGCGRHAHGRILVKAPYSSDSTANLTGTAFWCLCPCGEPTVIRIDAPPYSGTHQAPRAVEFVAGENWPPELSKLFVEASLSFSASAFTACAMVCRKILMAVACKQGDAEGETFAHYVDYIIQNVVPIPTAKAPIDAIRTIGNEANHDLAFVSEADARRAMGIAKYVLTAAYSLPSA